MASRTQIWRRASALAALALIFDAPVRAQAPTPLQAPGATVARSEQASEGPTAAESETARSLMDDGDQLLSAGDLEGALERYRAAHDIMHVPTTAVELARVQAKLGLLVEARRSAIEVANMPRARTEPPAFKEARTDASRLADELEPRVPALTVLVSPPSSDYSLTIDGVTLPESARGLPFRTNPGEHVALVEARGYATKRQRVVLREGEKRSLDLELTANPMLAGVAVPRANAVQLPALVPAPEEDHTAAAARKRGIISLGVGGAFLLAGGVPGVMSLIQSNDIESRCIEDRCPHTERDAIARANALANLSNIWLALGAVGLGYGLFELLVNGRSRREPERAALRMALAGPGLQMAGQW